MKEELLVLSSSPSLILSGGEGVGAVKQNVHPLLGLLQLKYPKYFPVLLAQVFLWLADVSTAQPK